jgi:hypothetical protein
MITISITAEAYEAIKATLPEGSETWDVQPDDGRGGFRIALAREFVDRLGQMRGPGRAIPTSSCGWRALHRLWTPSDRAFSPWARSSKRLVSRASPCFAISRATEKRPRRPQGAHTGKMDEASGARAIVQLGTLRQQ